MSNLFMSSYKRTLDEENINLVKPAKRVEPLLLILNYIIISKMQLTGLISIEIMKAMI